MHSQMNSCISKTFILCLLVSLVFTGLTIASAETQDQKNTSLPDTAGFTWTEAAYRRAQPSIVVVKQIDDHGQTLHVGTGFAISNDLIATCAHVTGEGRRLAIEYPEGHESPVSEIVAWDESLDLALIRGEAPNPPPLPLGTKEPVPGSPILAFGNPQGLRGSVTAGVISGMQTIQGTPLLQLAVPIEQGNSGGPIITSDGNVVGILTLKSSVTDNLGFAVPIIHLIELQRRATPVSMDEWLGIDSINLAEWEPGSAGNWRSSRHAITVTCQGEPTTGRTICWKRSEPKNEHDEWLLWLQFDSFTGGAGIAFGGPDKVNHGGLFVSEGQLWLTQFIGSQADEWRTAAQTPAHGWRNGNWNQLRIQFRNEAITAWLNGHQLLDLQTERQFRWDHIGLLKLGTAHANFRGLRSRKSQPPENEAQAIEAIVKLASSGADEDFDSDLPISFHAMEEAARQLQDSADFIRRRNRDLKRNHVASELGKRLLQPDFDPARCSLLAAGLIDIDAPLEMAWEQWLAAKQEIAEQALNAKTDADFQNLYTTLLRDTLGWRIPSPYQLLPLDRSLIAAWDRRRIAPEVFHALVLSIAPQFNTALFEDTPSLVFPQTHEPQTNPSAKNNPKSLIIQILSNLIAPHLKNPPVQILPALNIIIEHSSNPARERFVRGVIHLQEQNQEEWMTDWNWARAHAPDELVGEWIGETLAIIDVTSPAWKRGLGPVNQRFKHLTNEKPSPSRKTSITDP